jgi:hypothetical protein
MASYLREKGLGKKEGKEENLVCVWRKVIKNSN